MSADEMFEELRYKKAESEIEVIYTKDIDVIYIDKQIRLFAIYCNNQKIVPKTFNAYELEALYKKCEELGWI